ncbi:hypothetical protein LUZ60_002074 [Juncus effusus]|nr:hypothetical protein LUZ60_002074 [Juncus effusus]
MAAADEKVRMTAQHIVRTLATSKNAADDMIRILSGFDDRFSDLFPPSAASASASTDTSGIGGDPAAEMSLETVDEVNDDSDEEEILGRGGISEEKARDEISEEDSVKLEMAEKLIMMWDASANLSSPLFDSPSESSQYLSAIDDLLSLSSSPSFPSSLSSRAESSLQLAMSRLEDEFRHLLSPPLDPSSLSLSCPSLHTFSLRRTSLSSDVTDPESPVVGSELEHSLSLPLSSDLVSPFLIPGDSVSDLKDIADRMIRAGYGPELCQAYGDSRREALAECLNALGVDKMSIEEVQKVDWAILDSKMKKWIQALKIVIRGMLFEEKDVCETVFGLSERIKEECFAEAAKGCVLQLLNFGDAIAIGKRTAEKLFRIVGMYEALHEILPDLESLFAGKARVFVLEEARGILSRLGDAVKGTILEFGNLIRGEVSKRPLQYGEIHPLTRYVMNYIRLLADYSAALNNLLASQDESSGSNGSVGAGTGTAEAMNLSPLGQCVLTLITYLEANLDEKKKLYDDEALQHIFIMNNLLYIVQKVKDSELKGLLGDNWIRKRQGQIRQHSTGYLRSTWTKVLSFLKDDGLSGGSGASNKNALKEKFKNFNLAFEEIYRVQTGWKVSDPQLKEELKISVCEMMIQAYRGFYGRFKGQFEGGRNTSKYIKYTPEDLDNHVSDLFEGFQGVPGNPRRREAA